MPTPEKNTQFSIGLGETPQHYILSVMIPKHQPVILRLLGLFIVISLFIAWIEPELRLEGFGLVLTSISVALAYLKSKQT